MGKVGPVQRPDSLVSTLKLTLNQLFEERLVPADPVTHAQYSKLCSLSPWRHATSHSHTPYEIYVLVRCHHEAG